MEAERRFLAAFPTVRSYGSVNGALSMVRPDGERIETMLFRTEPEVE